MALPLTLAENGAVRRSLPIAPADGRASYRSTQAANPGLLNVSHPYWPSNSWKVPLVVTT